MNTKIFSVFLIILASYSTSSSKTITKRQIWYSRVNCEYGPFGVICEAPKTVITPFNHPLPWNPNAGDQRSPTDPILASPSINPTPHCRPDQFSCLSPHQCYEKNQLCDGQVNCVDGSDETDCSCTRRLDPSKMCDNYYDCPDASDEIGCFGCEKDSYSCHYNETEYIKNSRQAECYAITEKCDRFEQCSSGKDEEDCLLLSPKKTSAPDPFVRGTEGFLYMNYKNQWYPVCLDLFNWAKSACIMEQGKYLKYDPTTSYQQFTYSGKYIKSTRGSHNNAIRIVDNCTVPGIMSRNAILHVKCPYVCGQPLQFENQNYQSLRISGGQQAALGSHPWLVSVHVNGTFLCGGSIVDRKWIVTAAHCLMKRNKQTVGQYDYMEIRAGNLRQSSFTPHEQTVRVSNVSIHNGFDHESLRSDVALLELKEPLRYNRWVQPICLPTQNRIISDSALNWIEQYEKMICLAAGWGDFTFRGGSSPVDNAREVELPIVRSCDPVNPGVFCAGYTEGGFDTCYSDSGGPFVCTSETNRTNFFLAGIASYGYNPNKEDVRCGEPNSFSVFTKMSLFSPYIDQMKEYAPNSPLREKCPGRRCRSNKRCVGALNGIVECLGGEDEIYHIRERKND